MNYYWFNKLGVLDQSAISYVKYYIPDAPPITEKGNYISNT